MSTLDSLGQALDRILAEAEAEAEADARAPRPLILVVEDNPVNARILYEFLKDDYEVCLAVTGEAALAFCAARLPDLVLLDVTMPGMDGYEVCRQIKAGDITRSIPIIFTTAHNSHLAEAKALGEGAADFISKPIDQGVVRARVRNQILRKIQGDALRSLAMTDALTGVANRRWLDDALGEECRRARLDRTSLSILLLDVDRFKSFNDRYGHQAGDRCLEVIARTVKATVRRSGDLVARYGGDELAILLPRSEFGFAGEAAAKAVCAIQALALPHAANADCGGVVTISVGAVALGPADQPFNADELLAAADLALYQAKAAGRNRAMSWTTRGYEAAASAPSARGETSAGATAIPPPRRSDG